MDIGRLGNVVSVGLLRCSAISPSPYHHWLDLNPWVRLAISSFGFRDVFIRVGDVLILYSFLASTLLTSRSLSNARSHSLGLRRATLT